MTKRILIKNTTIVNEGKSFVGDVLIEDDRITNIDTSISLKHPNTRIINADGLYLLPGMIDDQVHFREPGLTHKEDIEAGSKTAVAGGITSFIEMPNTVPQAVTIEELEKKFSRAAEVSWANYSFMMGGTNDNIKEVLKVDPKMVAGLKLFLGSSTGNMLVDDEKVLEEFFTKTPLLISAHCEDEQTIRENTKKYTEEYNGEIPIEKHPEIRSADACYISSSRAVALAKKTGARLHVFHVSTGIETKLFSNKKPLKEKKITAEVCVHHLWFTDKDYAEKGTKIKWNPAVKTEKDRELLWKALLDDRIDVIATDHAPHTIEEKNGTYLDAPSGGPLVQHAMVALLEMYHRGKISLEKIVEKTSHNPAILFEIKDRGYIREGYKADVVLVDLNAPWTVKKENIFYKCGWSPFEGTTFKSRITHTIVNGELVYEKFKFNQKGKAERLAFNR